jgi:hypothetical protein
MSLFRSGGFRGRSRVAKCPQFGSKSFDLILEGTKRGKIRRGRSQGGLINGCVTSRSIQEQRLMEIRQSHTLGQGVPVSSKTELHRRSRAMAVQLIVESSRRSDPNLVDVRDNVSGFEFRLGGSSLAQFQNSDSGWSVFQPPPQVDKR